MITREEVIAAYRVILGREPESEEVIASHISNTQNIMALREKFLRGPEFKANAGKALYGLGGPIDVQVHCRKRDLMTLLKHVEESWARMGEEEPMFSVLTEERYKPDRFPAHAGQFYQSGQHDIERFIVSLRRNNIGYEGIETCLEFGCGVGRVTRWLANITSRVIACDISQPHLRLANEYLNREGIRNTTLLHVASMGALARIPTVDAVFTVLVLQHNPPPVIAKLLEALMAKLRPGGVAYFQVPTYKLGYSFDLATYLSSPIFMTKQMEMHVLPQRNIFHLMNESRCSLLEVNEDHGVGEVDVISNTFLIKKDKSRWRRYSWRGFR